MSLQLRCCCFASNKIYMYTQTLTNMHVFWRPVTVGINSEIIVKHLRHTALSLLWTIIGCKKFKLWFRDGPQCYNFRITCWSLPSGCKDAKGRFGGGFSGQSSSICFHLIRIQQSQQNNSNTLRKKTNCEAKLRYRRKARLLGKT
jgi:hypothetical protein